jgi:hypothetical protein
MSLKIGMLLLLGVTTVWSVVAARKLGKWDWRATLDRWRK